MRISDKTYDLMKWLVMIVIPAAITFFGVIAQVVDIPHSEAVITIATAGDTFLGTILGISSATYKAEQTGEK